MRTVGVFDPMGEIRAILPGRACVFTQSGVRKYLGVRYGVWGSKYKDVGPWGERSLPECLGGER